MREEMSIAIAATVGALAAVMVGGIIDVLEKRDAPSCPVVFRHDDVWLQRRIKPWPAGPQAWNLGRAAREGIPDGLPAPDAAEGPRKARQWAWDSR